MGCGQDARATWSGGKLALKWILKRKKNMAAWTKKPLSRGGKRLGLRHDFGKQAQGVGTSEMVLRIREAI